MPSQHLTAEEQAVLNRTNGKTKTKGFTPTPKGDRPSFAQPETATPDPNQVVGAYKTDIAGEGAIVLSTTSAQAIGSLHSEGLGNAAAYVKRKTMERNALVDRVSDAIAYLSDPDVLEADIMSAAAAKVAARSDAWGYAETRVDFDTLFALPSSSQHLLSGT